MYILNESITEKKTQDPKTTKQKNHEKSLGFVFHSFYLNKFTFTLSKKRRNTPGFSPGI
jgi:hypothetical protein